MATTSLSKIADVFNGKTPSKADQRSSGYPVLKIRDINEHGQFRGGFESFVDPSYAEKYSAKKVCEGDTLILNAAHNAAYVASKCCLAASSFATAIATGEWLIVRPHSSVAVPEYVNFWLRSSATKDQIRFLVKGIHLYPKDVADLKMTLPSLTEQRRIVDLLTRAEGIVRLRREAAAKAAELIPGIFIDMFGDPKTNAKGLDVRKVADVVARFEGGKNIQAGDGEASGLRILKVSAVTSGAYIEAECKPAPNDYVAPPRHLVQAGDMLFSRANTSELVGATALVEQTNGSTLLPDKLWRIVWREEVDALYMWALFQSKAVRQELSKLASGTSDSMRNISQAKLFELALPVAALNEQKRFGEMAKAARSIQKQQDMALEKAQATFNALLAQAFAAPTSSTSTQA
jgi:type I restriction enzyme S subunit